MSPQHFKESKSSFDLVSTDNHGQDFSEPPYQPRQDHKCEVITAVHQNMKDINKSMNKPCGEDEFIEEHMFYHAIQ